MKPHQEVDRVEGCPIGRDPRRMSDERKRPMAIRLRDTKARAAAQ